MRTISLANRVFKILSSERLLTKDRNPHLGTGFSVLNSRIVVTAGHVVENCHDLVVYSAPAFSVDRTSLIFRHPSADIAALVVSKKFSENVESWDLLSDPSNDSEIFIGENVWSIGYPQLGIEKPIPERLLKGHIMRMFNDCVSGTEHFEVAMPAFFGQSGSPILLQSIHKIRDTKAIGLVSKSVGVSSNINEETNHISYTLCVSLSPHIGWLRKIQSNLD